MVIWASETIERQFFEEVSAKDADKIEGEMSNVELE